MSINAVGTYHWREALEAMNPCDDAMAWLESYSDPIVAWRECKRGDWMLWLLGNLSGKPESDGRKKLVLCAVECARLAPKIKNRKREAARLRCLRTATAWANGRATIQQVRVAANANDAAAAAYAAAAAAYFVDAGTSAAIAAYYANTVRRETLAKAADIVRKHYPQPPNLEVVR